MWDDEEVGPDDGLYEECPGCGQVHDDDEIVFAMMAENAENQIIDPGQEEVMGRMAFGDERFEAIRQHLDDVAIASLRTQQASAQCIFAQGQVRTAVAGLIHGVTLVTMFAAPFVVLRLFRR